MSHFLNKLRAKKTSRLEKSSTSIDQSDGDLGVVEVRGDVFCRATSIASTVDILLKDSSALSFFIQYLESCEKLQLIKFWMHVEGFRSTFINLGGDISANSEAAAQALIRNDAQSIYDRYVTEGSTNSLGLPRSIQKITEDNLSQSILDCDCFEAAQMFVRQLFEYRYFQEFQSSLYYKKHELDVHNQGLTVSDIIHIPTLLQIFMEVLGTDFDGHCVQFLIACESFEIDYETLSVQNAMNDAMSIYERYFSMQAGCQLALRDVERIQMESSICTESGCPDKDAFAKARHIYTNIISEKYLYSFLSSTLYKDYVSDLSNQIENTLELPKSNRSDINSSRSDSQSAISVSSNDSLPLIFNKHCELLEKTTGTDNKQNPSRSSCSSLAEVDELGRYKKLYDDRLTQHQQSTPSKLKMKLRRYINKSDIREVDMADEVARTIITDIQNMVGRHK